ncbi:hypothetical protein Pmani_007306 [Petrolisthes manimaculis]|uniref:Uncharacterized protein n=1 Tax=Petrolisthes manimaculis TaxID=1843537 RepID=A0AAE1Q7U9_9EUCA|nr:hypothetical protein Pmani_007306 [Petrolisthes manimaculis]
MPKDDCTASTAPTNMLYRYTVRIKAENGGDVNNTYQAGEKVWVRPPNVRCDRQYGIGVVTRVMSDHAVEINGVSRHVQDVCHRSLSMEPQGGREVADEECDVLYISIPAQAVGDGVVCEDDPDRDVHPPEGPRRSIRERSRVLRQVATIGGMLTNAVYMGMFLYAPSLALSTVTALSVVASMCIMGGICTFYTTIGGVKAVVYTDVLQTLLMFGGVLVVVILCCIELGSVANVIDIADQGQRLEFFKLCWFFLVGLWVLWVLFYFSGMVAYATYSTCDPLAAGYITKADQILPYLVIHKLSHLPGLAGLFVAAVYGGVLSSVSSFGNSMACLVWEDFLKLRPYFSRLSDPAATKVIKLLSSVTGVLAVILGLMIGNLGNMFHVINIIVSCVYGPIVGIFLSGMLLPWTNYKGSLVGLVGAFAIFAWLVVGKFIYGGGAPTMLPLSTHGCHNNSITPLSPTITFNSSTYFDLTTSEMPDITSASSDE